MSERPQRIITTGTQVVTLVDFKDRVGTIFISKGVVGVILTARRTISIATVSGSRTV